MAERHRIIAPKTMLVVGVVSLAAASGFWKVGAVIAERRAVGLQEALYEETRQALETQREYYRVGSVFPNFAITRVADSMFTTFYDALPHGGLVLYVSPDCSSCELTIEALRSALKELHAPGRAIIIATGPYYHLKEWETNHPSSIPIFQDHSDFIRSGGEFMVLPAMALVNEYHEVLTNNTGSWNASDYAAILSEL